MEKRCDSVAYCSADRCLCAVVRQDLGKRPGSTLEVGNYGGEGEREGVAVAAIDEEGKSCRLQRMFGISWGVDVEEEKEQAIRLRQMGSLNESWRPRKRDGLATTGWTLGLEPIRWHKEGTVG